MRREDRAVVVPLAFLHGTVHANILAVPVFLQFAWRNEFGADDFTVGLLAATLFLCFGLSSVPFGFLADLRAPTRLLLACVGGIALSLGAIALSSTLPFLAVSLAALGLSSGIYHPTALSAISRTVEAQGRGMGWHGMGGSLGIAAGPAIVGLLLNAGWSWRLAVGVLILPSLFGIAWLAVRRWRAPGKVPSEGVREPLRSLGTRGYGRTLLVYFFAGLAYQGSLTFLPKPQFLGAGPFAAALGFGAIGQVVAGTLADRRRPDRILTALSLAGSVLLVLLAMLIGSLAFVGVGLAYGFVLFSLEALQNTLVTRTVPRSWRGTAFGLSFLSVFGFGSIGAALAGWLLARGQTSLLFIVLGASLATSGGMAFGVGVADKTDEGD